MERYLQILVITLPALTIAMGALLLIVFMCLRSWSKAPPNGPIRQCSVNTQFDGPLQMPQEIRDKLVEEAMARVKMYLSEEFRKKQATKISQEEFNKLYRKQQRGLDSESSTDGTEENRKRQEIMESGVCRIPGIAPLNYAITTTQSDSASLKKTDSFATLWVEELQRSGDAKPAQPDTQRGSEIIPDSKTEALSRSQQSIVACRDSSATGFDSTADQADSVFTQLGFSKATAMNQVKSWNELKLLNDLEMFLLTDSSNLCRSIMAFSMDYKPGSGITLSSSKEVLCMMPSRSDLELGSNELASVASTSASMNSAPRLLKGGAPNHSDNFVWHLDIEEKDVDPSPPNTPVRHQSHLCRGVQFLADEHPPALSLIDLDPELGHGWRGPDWKETFGKHHVYSEREGPRLYQTKKLKLAANPCIMEYYKSVDAEAKKRWERVQDRYRRSQELATLKVQIREDIWRSAGWRKHLRETSHCESDSSRNSSEIEADEKRRENSENRENDENRVRSMLSTSTTSSSSTLDSDEATTQKIRGSTDTAHSGNQKPQCRRNHRHCTFGKLKTNRRNY